MKFSYLLLILLVIVGVGGLVYTMRPGDDVELPEPPVETAEPVDNTTPFPPPEPTPLQEQIKPINQTVNVTLETSQGSIDIELHGADAPLTVGNFVTLAQNDFYDGTTFHRVIPDFMIQGGDPLSKDSAMRARHGTGGPDYRFQDEINERKVVRGALAMANAGPNTNGSQFFIVVNEAVPHLDGLHTVFGTVTAGMDIVDTIVAVPTDARDNPLEAVTITDVVVKDAPEPPDPALEIE